MGNSAGPCVFCAERALLPLLDRSLSAEAGKTGATETDKEDVDLSASCPAHGPPLPSDFALFEKRAGDGSAETWSSCCRQASAGPRMGRAVTEGTAASAEAGIRGGCARERTSSSGACSSNSYMAPALIRAVVGEDICVVCFDPLSQRALTFSACGHIFHRNCLSLCGTGFCPTCRKPIDEPLPPLPILSAGQRSTPLWVGFELPDRSFRHVEFTHRPLGLNFVTRATPITLKRVRQGSLAAELGVRASWKLRFIDQKDVSELEFEDAYKLILETSGQLPAASVETLL